MAFQTKNFVSIVASMINLIRTRSDSLTDFNVGAVNRTIIEAPAQEIDELYQQMVAGLVAAVPVATYRTFNFTALLATAAGGVVRVTIASQTSPVLIPAGSTLTQASTSATYTTRVDVSIPAGSTYADVPVVATTVGVAGNLGASVAFTLATPPSGFVSASNLVAFINGSDDETEPQRKARFNAFIETLARGTIAALIFGAQDKAFLTDANGNVTERVVFASIFEPYRADNTQPVGWVQVYLHNGSGGTSSALVTQTQRILYGYLDATGKRVPGYKAAGVRTDVIAATELPVSLAGVVTAGFGYSSATLAAQAVTVVATYIGSLAIGQSFIKSKVIELVMDLPGVVDFNLTGSPTNLTATYSQKFMPGTLAFTGA